MELRKEALRELMENKFEGSYAKLARELDLDTAYVYRVLAKESNCGVRFFSGIMKWCKANNEDYEKYILIQ